MKRWWARKDRIVFGNCNALRSQRSLQAGRDQRVLKKNKQAWNVYALKQWKRLKKKENNGNGADNPNRKKLLFHLFNFLTSVAVIIVIQRSLLPVRAGIGRTSQPFSTNKFELNNKMGKSKKRLYWALVADWILPIVYARRRCAMKCIALL